MFNLLPNADVAAERVGLADAKPLPAASPRDAFGAVVDEMAPAGFRRTGRRPAVGDGRRRASLMSGDAANGGDRRAAIDQRVKSIPKPSEPAERSALSETMEARA